jgi:hypothetical protein
LSCDDIEILNNKISKFIYNNMSLIDKVNSVQGIALAALQATSNINTYLSTFVAPEIRWYPSSKF